MVSRSTANGMPVASHRRSAGASFEPPGHRVITGGIGRNLPQEAPRAFANAVVDVDRY